MSPSSAMVGLPPGTKVALLEDAASSRGQEGHLDFTNAMQGGSQMQEFLSQGLPMGLNNLWEKWRLATSPSSASGGCWCSSASDRLCILPVAPFASPSELRGKKHWKSNRPPFFTAWWQRVSPFFWEVMIYHPPPFLFNRWLKQTSKVPA